MSDPEAAEIVFNFATKETHSNDEYLIAAMARSNIFSNYSNLSEPNKEKALKLFDARAEKETLDSIDIKNMSSNLSDERVYQRFKGLVEGKKSGYAVALRAITNYIVENKKDSKYSWAVDAIEKESDPAYFTAELGKLGTDKAIDILITALWNQKEASKKAMVFDSLAEIAGKGKINEKLAALAPHLDNFIYFGSGKVRESAINLLLRIEPWRVPMHFVMQTLYGNSDKLQLVDASGNFWCISASCLF